MTHHPVLLQEVLAGLALRSGARVLDATVNRGGHARALCEAIGPEGQLIALDADENALREAEQNLLTAPGRKIFIQGNFRNLAALLAERNLKLFDACLFDLGLSTEQLSTGERGFSFQFLGPLLMTLSARPEVGELTAAVIVNDWNEAELFKIIRDYGEERFARPIAKAIVAARRSQRISTTLELAQLIVEAVPGWYRHRRIHPATKTFQALRIAVNDELTALVEGLSAAWLRLAAGGRLAVITFHSLEARLVKNLFRAWVLAAEGELITRHAVKPSRTESLAHPQARSAQLRIIKKN